MSVKTLKKDDLKLVAEELGLTVPKGAKVIDLKNLIENSEVYERDVEFVQNVIDNILEESKTKIERQKSENEIKLELEKIKLAQLEAELALADARSRELPQNQNSESNSSSLNIENLVEF